MSPAPDKDVLQAARALCDGGIIGHAAEGVWGLACDPYNSEAVERLLRLKERPAHKGLILAAANIDMFAPWLEGLPADRVALIQASWPGPVTWIVPDKGLAPPWIRGQATSLAIRLPDHAQMQAVSLAFGGPFVSTSANPSGQKAARSALEVRQYFAGHLTYVLPLGEDETAMLSGRSSTIKDALTLETLRG